MNVSDFLSVSKVQLRFSRSRLVLFLSSGIDGSSTIRVFCQGQTFLQRFHVAVDANSSAMLNFISGQRWLGLRIELLGSIIVLVSSVFVISLNDVWKIDPGLGTCTRFLLATYLYFKGPPFTLIRFYSRSLNSLVGKLYDYFEFSC